MTLAAHHWIAWLGCSLLAGCGDDTQSCNDAYCTSVAPSIRLVDDAGQRAPARGEQRTRRKPAPLSFDCTSTAGIPAQGDLACENGLLSPGDETYPGNPVELRFELADGSFTEWREVELAYTSHTDPDYNGPGCPCTSYTATAAPVVVPFDARMYSAPAGTP
jgi:hypothetical protein